MTRRKRRRRRSLVMKWQSGSYFIVFLLLDSGG